MMKLGVVVSLSLVASVAAADPIFYNATPGTFTVELTQPNGKVDKTKLDGNRPGFSSGYFLLPPNTKTAKVAIKDDTDASIWSGSTGVNDVMVIIPDGKGVKPIYAGAHGSDNGPHGMMFMNISGETMTLDLFGHNGVGSVKGVKPATSFEPKNLIKVEPNEQTYDVTAKGKDGADLGITEKISPDHYSLIWKDGNAKLHITNLGWIPKKK
jgi:hypothetical protein